MNIDEYKALKEKEEQAKSEGSPASDQPEATKGEQEPTQNEGTETPTEPTEPTTQSQEEGEQSSPSVESTDSQEKEPKATEPEKIQIEGIGEVTLDELKNGYLRQSDYTKKTQDVSKQRKEAEEALGFYEQVKQNPQIANQLKKQGEIPKSLDPATAKLVDLESKYYDLVLEKEIESLQGKYDDFEVKDVLNTAHEKGITNLEDAYKIVKASKQDSTSKNSEVEPVDTESLKEQLRKEILQELDEKNTDTIISSNDNQSVTSSNEPKISEGEKKVAKGMFRHSKDPIGDYITWRDAK